MYRYLDGSNADAYIDEQMLQATLPYRALNESINPQDTTYNAEHISPGDINEYSLPPEVNHILGHQERPQRYYIFPNHDHVSQLQPDSALPWTTTASVPHSQSDFIAEDPYDQTSGMGQPSQFSSPDQYIPTQSATCPSSHPTLVGQHPTNSGDTRHNPTPTTTDMEWSPPNYAFDAQYHIHQQQHYDQN